MRHHRIRSSPPPTHRLLAAALIACAIAVALAPSMGRWAAPAASATLAAHGGFALALHLCATLVGTGVVVAAVRSFRAGHPGGREDPGTVLHSPRCYDCLAAAYCLGREARMRERTLDLAGVGAGARVLDVCCGTGTLALAAQRRMGASGYVHGIDASPDMISHAKWKAAHCGLPVEFQVAAAQSLPFPDGTFDVAMCSLALHHLPAELRSTAIEEMRRVVRPGGCVLVVDCARGRGMWALFHPVALLHQGRSGILEGVIALMRDSGLERLESGPLSCAGLAYAVAYRR